MSILVGIDMVEIARCARWITYSDAILLKWFSPDEIAYCRSDEKRFTERCAARFAAREACYKALNSYARIPAVPFRSMCRAVAIENTRHGPFLRIEQELLSHWYLLPSVLNITISWSHTASMAVAVVVIAPE